MLLLFSIILSSTSAASSTATAPRPAFPVEVDHFLNGAWRSKHIAPANAADDATFLRRASLDLLGVIPDADLVRRFLADQNKNKRAALIDALIADPTFVAHWTDVLDELLMTRAEKTNKVDRVAFRAFIAKALSAGWGWDKLVASLISATGKTSAGGKHDNRRHLRNDDEAPDPEVNGATNWLLSFDDNIEDMAGTVSRTFLSVQIQCAQCHDHVTEQWKQQDFQRFAAFFTDLKAKRISEEKGKSAVFEVLDNPQQRLKPKQDDLLYAIAHARPTTLDGQTLASDDAAETRRAFLAQWLTSAKNPYFARAAVNRFWAHFLGHGFFQPFDDLREKNPPVLPELFSTLSQDFAMSGFDLRRLFRQICNSVAYARSAAPADKHDVGNRYFARFSPRLLTTDELFSSLVKATGSDDSDQNDDKIEKLLNGAARQFRFVFDVDDDSAAETTRLPTISQALLLMNGPLSVRGIRAGSLAKSFNEQKSFAEMVSDAYVAILGRPPTHDERDRWLVTLGEDDNRRLGKEDLIWTLLNSAEFSFNH